MMPAIDAKDKFPSSELPASARQDVLAAAPEHKVKKSWRGVLPIHPAADLFPLMTPGELRALGDDIIKNGLTSLIVLWSDGKSPALLLDGRNRLDAIEIATGHPVEIGAPSVMAGKDFLATNTVIALGKSVDPFAYVISANIHRRHLTAEQKRELIAKLIKAQPEKSDRQIAETVKVDHKTVGVVRAVQEARGEIPHVEIRTDSKGRQQPARKAPTKPTPIPAPNSKSKSKSKSDGKARDDIGPASNGEMISRLQARVDALQAELRQCEIKFTGLESENQELKQQAVKPTGAEPLTVLVELLRQIITDAQQPAWLKSLSRHKQHQALNLVERLCSNLYDLIELRRTAAKAMPDITPPSPPTDDGLDIPDYLDRRVAR
jgi:hypothetical protein